MSAVMTKVYSPLASPSSPGVGARRKIPKIPRLPLSAFTPPNSGTSDNFPQPPSPSTVHPGAVVDANVTITVDQWKSETEGPLGKKAQGVVLCIDANDTELHESIALAQKDPSVIAISIPFPLEAGPPSTITTFSANVPIVLRTIFTKFTHQHAEGIYWAVSNGYIVEIDVRSSLSNDEEWEGLNELISSAMSSERPQISSAKGAIVISNILPAPHDLSLPLVKLLTHPTYRSFQNYAACLSLQSAVYLKFLPPSWGAAIPSRETNGDFKRRIKMFLGHAIEAFGYQRIVFGSSSLSNAGDWYELARESLTELGVEQEAVDAVFSGNALELYRVRV